MGANLLGYKHVPERQIISDQGAKVTSWHKRWAALGVRLNNADRDIERLKKRKAQHDD